MGMVKRHGRPRRRSGGFTLIELMIVVAIVGILVAIGYPAYNEYVRRSYRTDARNLLLDTAQRLERCMSTYGAYNNAGCGVGFPQVSSEGFYTIAAADANITATTFTLVARPVAGGPQAADADCTSFSLTNAGVRNATGADAPNCW
ncbi:MAG: type IV pilin protein [Gammaproteobacteria bacterium]